MLDAPCVRLSDLPAGMMRARARSLRFVADYFLWRQADTHIINRYNTTFWALVQRGGLSEHEAHEKLKGSLAKDKNELLFSQFGINYNNEPGIEIFRKGSLILRGGQGEGVGELDGGADPLRLASASGGVARAETTARKPREAAAVSSLGPDEWDAAVPGSAAGRKKRKHESTELVLSHADIMSDAWWKNLGDRCL